MADRLHGDERGVSEVLEYVFIFSLVVASIGVVTVGGMGSLENAQTAEQIENAEKGFGVLHDTMAELYDEGAPSRATELSLGETELFYGDNVTVNVTVVDGETTTVTEREIRPVVQRLGPDRFLVYEAGAVFRTTADGGLTVLEPPHMYRTDGVHVTVPAFRSGSVQGVGSSNVLVRAKVTNRSVPVTDADGSDKVVVNVTSPRYEQWASYLEDQPSVDCTVDDPNSRVTCTRDSDLERVYVSVTAADLFLLQ